EIPNFGGKEFHTPTAINERGEAAGFGNHVGDLITEAFFWSREKGFHGLGYLPGHGFSEAFGINNRGQVVGLSCTAAITDCRAFLWQNGVMLDLNQFVDLPPGVLRLTHAMDINDDGVITGRAITAASTLPAYLATPVQSTVSLVARHKQLAPLRIPADLAGEIVGPMGPGRARLTRR